MSKNLFERLHLVERVPDGESIPLSSVDSPPYLPDTETLEVSIYGDAEVSGENHKPAGEGFILATYKNNGLIDEEGSIFKIEELRSALPDTLPKDAQRESVKKMLTVFGLDRNVLIDDGQLRIETLICELKKYMTGKSNEILDMENQIDEAKVLIQKLEAEIQETREMAKSIDLAVEDQINHIEELCKFIKDPSSGEEV